MGNKNFILLFVLVTVATGCAVGPDFRTPNSLTGKTYTGIQVPEKTASARVKGGGEQLFVSGKDIPEVWWEVFHSKPLDLVIRKAIEHNPSLSAAEASLREAQENFHARAGVEYFPSVDIAASGTRQKTSTTSMGQRPEGKGSLFNLFNASVNVSYVLDIFGSGRRELESLRAAVDYQRFQRQAAYLSLTSNLVVTVIKEASLRAQLQAMHEILFSQEQHLSMLKKQFDLGGVSQAEVFAQTAQVEQSRAALAPLDKELSLTRHQLVLLTGGLPEESVDLPEFKLDDFDLPGELPLTLPSELLRQRPDIQAAEALLHAASAKVGVATANLYPQITLSGSYGLQENRSHDLLSGGDPIWNVGASLIQPVLNGGQLRAKRRAAAAAYDQSLANYRQVILNAFQNVADVLKSLESDALALKAQADFEKAASNSLDLTRQQFESGAVSYILLLDAQRQYQQSRIALIQAQAARFADTAALFQALGGGWRADKQEKTR